MNIFTVNLKPKVLEYNEGKVKIFVDYPDIEQGQELKSLMFDNLGMDIKWEKDKDDKLKPKFDNLTSGQVGQMVSTEFKLKVLRVKYCLKGWVGIVDENGQPFECVIENNALSRDVLNKVMTSEWIDVVYQDMSELLRWTDADKKKFISSEDSNLKVD